MASWLCLASLRERLYSYVHKKSFLQGINSTEVTQLHGWTDDQHGWWEDGCGWLQCHWAGRVQTHWGRCWAEQRPRDWKYHAGNRPTEVCKGLREDVLWVWEVLQSSGKCPPDWSRPHMVFQSPLDREEASCLDALDQVFNAQQYIWAENG